MIQFRGWTSAYKSEGAPLLAVVAIVMLVLALVNLPGEATPSVTAQSSLPWSGTITYTAEEHRNISYSHNGVAGYALFDNNSTQVMYNFDSGTVHVTFNRHFITIGPAANDDQCSSEILETADQIAPATLNVIIRSDQSYRIEAANPSLPGVHVEEHLRGPIDYCYSPYGVLPWDSSVTADWGHNYDVQFSGVIGSSLVHTSGGAGLPADDYNGASASIDRLFGSIARSGDWFGTCPASDTDIPDCHGTAVYKNIWDISRGPTPTPTQPPSATMTVTDVPTNTNTTTPIATSTATSIPTDTPTATPTAVPTNTSTATPTATATSTGTATVTPTATPAGRTRYVLIQGIDTELKSGGHDFACGRQAIGLGSDVFALLRTRLLESPLWGNPPCTDVLYYSYAGGALDESGNWVPNPYNCETVKQPVGISELRLKQMLDLYRSAHPGDRFVLIGHSLGGLIAFEVGGAASRPDVAKVLTVDSPLNHVYTRNKDAFDEITLGIVGFRTLQRFCATQTLIDSPVASYIADKDTANSAAIQNAQRQVVINKPTTRFMTIGNRQDCVWSPPKCSLSNADNPGGPQFTNDPDTQVVSAAAIARLYDLETGGCGDARHVFPLTRTLLCLPDSHNLALGPGAPLIDMLDFITAP